MVNVVSNRRSRPVVVTVKESNVPEDYRVINKLQDGHVVALSPEAYADNEEEFLREID